MPSFRMYFYTLKIIPQSRLMFYQPLSKIKWVEEQRNLQVIDQK
jgi:hypothetical protein